ncbi:MAG: ribonuclease HI family protein [Nitrososphaeraceae archaeon]|nr:ribonuclease HI family protein [Nitrososphaeraceae archaeon]
MLVVNIDGASRGNPGPAGIGVVFVRDNTRITEYKEFIGKKTNNQAEYAALKKALQIASTFDNELTVLSDSQLIVNQRNKLYRVRSKQLKIIFREISNLERRFKMVIYKHIPREKNEYADLLANQAIDEHNNKYQNNAVRSMAAVKTQS